MRVFIFFLLLTSNALAIEFDLVCRGNVVGTAKGISHETSKLLDEYIVVAGMVGKDGKLTKSELDTLNSLKNFLGKK